MKKMLSTYEMAILLKGAEEERAKDIQLHSFPHFETNYLLDKYNSWMQGEEKYDCCVVSALEDIAEFWGCYFSCGAEVAFTLKKEKEDAYLKKLTQETLRRYEENCKELEAMIAERKAEKA